MKKKKGGFNYKKVSVVVLAFTTPISLLYLGFSTQKSESLALSPSNTKTVYPKQYSDSHITENAKVSLPKFRNIAFIDKENLLGNVVSTIVKDDFNPPPSEQESGTWLWTPILNITPKYTDSIIAAAKKNNITNIYLSIDSYLDIYIMPEAIDKDKKRKEFDKIIEDFIRAAKKNNITVDAEAGWRNWAEPGNSYKAFATINYAIKFNKTHSVKFRGFQYDVEPYLLENYQKDKKTALSNFLTLIDQSVSQLNKSDLELSVVIPEFYDGTNNDTPQFSYRGEKGFATDHLLKILDHRANSKIIIMSYRNFSLGDDGSVHISKNEVEAANKHSTKIIVAQESGDVLPPYITFHNTSQKYYNRQAKNIKSAFATEKSFGGIAVHYINAFMELK